MVYGMTPCSEGQETDREDRPERRALVVETLSLQIANNSRPCKGASSQRYGDRLYMLAPTHKKKTSRLANCINGASTRGDAHIRLGGHDKRTDQ